MLVLSTSWKVIAIGLFDATEPSSNLPHRTGIQPGCNGWWRTCSFSSRSTAS